MPFFEKAHSFQIHNAEMNDAQRDIINNRNTDNRTGGHNFSGPTDYRSHQDTYSGSYNGGNFGGNGSGGNGFTGNKNRSDTYNGDVNNGNRQDFSGSRIGGNIGSGYTSGGTQTTHQTANAMRDRGGMLSPATESTDDDQYDSDEELARQVERKRQLVAEAKAKKAKEDRRKRLEAEQAALDAELAALNEA